MQFLPTRPEKILAAILLATTFLTLWAVLIYPIIDGDIWFHLLYAKEMLAQHTLIVDHSQISWTPSTNTAIYYTWLGQLIYYALYTLAGDAGVLFFSYLVTTAFFVFALHLAWQRGTLYHPITWLGCVLCVILIPLVVLDKPDLLSMLFAACMMWNWFQVRQGGKHVLLHLYLFPLIILLWVNTHGIFVFGCILLAVMAFGETCNQLLYKKQALPRPIYYHLLTSCLLAAGCTLLTPYGPDYILQLASAHFDTSNQQNLAAVQAWNPTFDLSSPRIIVFAYGAVALLILTLLAALRQKELDCVPVLMNLLFAYLFTHYIRLTYLWLPVFFCTVAYYAASFTPARPRIRLSLLLAAALFGTGINSWGLYQQKIAPANERWPDFGHSDLFTAPGETAFIAKHYPTAKIGNTYGYGAYLLWQLWPQQKVMMDARYFPYEDWFQEYLAFDKGHNVAAFLERYPADVMVVPHQHAELKKAIVALKQWSLVFLGKNALVYVFDPDRTVQLALEHGEEIQTITAYQQGLKIFHSVMLHRDWQGLTLLMQVMQSKFNTPEQVKQMAGLQLLKSVLEHYDQQQYAQAKDLLKQVKLLQAYDPDIQSAVELMLGKQKWEQGEHRQAVQATLRSLAASNTLAGTYNLSVMAWQLARQHGDGALPDLGLPELQAQSVANWRNVLQSLTKRTSYRPEYLPYIENAKKILANDPEAKVMFIPASWM